MCYNMHNKNQKGNVMADQFDNNVTAGYEGQIAERHGK